MQKKSRSKYHTVRASTFSRTELFRVPYRTVLLANRIIFGETNFFLAYRYSMVRYGTLKIRLVKKSIRVLYIKYAHRLYHEPRFFAYRTELTFGKLIFLAKQNFFGRTGIAQFGTLRLRSVRKSAEKFVEIR